jgi:hypothetical protein
MSDEDRMRAEIMSMQERADQTTDEVHGFILNYCIDEYFFYKFNPFSCSALSLTSRIT